MLRSCDNLSNFAACLFFHFAEVSKQTNKKVYKQPRN